MEFNEIFDNCIKENCPEITVSDTQKEQFRTLCDMLIEKNAVMNLTAITDVDGIIARHFADCLFALEHIPKNSKLIDIGCGGGFPTLPIAIMRPDVSVTALDSTAKKLGFVSDSALALGLENVVTLPARAEEVAVLPEYRERFDVAISRAVARLNILSELCIPFVRMGGKFVALKAMSGEEELCEAKGGIAKLGCKKITSQSLYLTENGERNLRVIVTAEKTAPTPKQYPRKFAQIKKSPM